jgi:hypothetical protein
MNFDPVGITKDGDYFMKFRKPFSVIEKIQLLQRWILVQSFAYYELNENIASDFKYDANAKQLVELMKNHPEEANRSKYSEYFHDYCPEDDDAHYTSGFDLLDRVRKLNSELYRYIHIDAAMALDLKAKYGTEGISRL